MDADGRPGGSARHEPDVAVTDAPPVLLPGRSPVAADHFAVVPSAASGGTDAAPPRGRPAVPLVLALVSVLVLGSALVLVLLLAMRSGGDVVVGPSAPGDSGDQGPPAPLGMSVEVPATVVAGEPATLTVRWADGEGVFAGTSEEWGDGVGTSSLRRTACEAGAAPADASGDTYDVSHTWSEPGTYSVVIGVATFTCEGGTSSGEETSRTLTVEVLPAG